MDKKETLAEILVSGLENRIASLLQKRKKVDVELLQIPNIDKYMLMKPAEEYGDATPESIKRLLLIAKKYATTAVTMRLQVLESNVNAIISGIRA